MAGKRAPATPTQESPSKVARRISTSTAPVMDAVALRNAQQSPFLRLPAELRNRVYELVFGGLFIHVEAEPRKKECKNHDFNQAAWTELTGATYVTHSKGWCDSHCLHYYPCHSVISEDTAYARSQDRSLDERLPGDAEALANYWRFGDAFYIEPCKERHKSCYPPDNAKPEWMMTPGDRAKRGRIQPIDLMRDLSLAVLQTCSQIYTEARSLPIAKNIYGFRNVLALMWFVLRLNDHQTTTLKSLWMFWRAGASTHMSDARRWNKWLSAPSLSARLQGLRVVHLSLSIVHAGMGDRGPVRREYQESDLHSWVEGLDTLRRLPLEQVTVVIADDPSSKFGIGGYFDRHLHYGWDSHHEGWLDLREQECFAADEKRQWAEQLRKHLLRQTTEVRFLGSQQHPQL